MPLPYHCDVIRHWAERTTYHSEYYYANGVEISVWRFYRVQLMYGVLQSEPNTQMPSYVNLMVEKWLERLLSTCTASASHHLLVIITELVKLHRKFRCFLHQSMTKPVHNHEPWVSGWVHWVCRTRTYVRTSRQIINHRIIQHPIASTIISS